MSPRLKPLHFVLAASLVSLTAPAMAAGQPVTDADGRLYGDAVPDPRPEWQPGRNGHGPGLPPMPPAPGEEPMGRHGYERSAFDEARADWLYECRRRYGSDRSGRDGTAGGIVGSVVGGIAGSAIAGRGNRTIGAIAGGTIGAIAGSAIGKSSDRRRARESADYCESYLEQYLARQQPAYGHGAMQPAYGYGYAMQPVMMMVPVAMVPVTAPAPRQDCTETTVVEEWVPVTTRKRHIAPRRHVVPDKRVRIVPDKRLRAN